MVLWTLLYMKEVISEVRNPAHIYVPNMTPEEFELSDIPYWENLSKDAYILGLEKSLDYLLGIRRNIEKISEFRAGSGEFLRLLRDYRELMEKDFQIGGTDSSEILQRLESRGDIYDVTTDLSDSDIVFIVEYLPYVADWQSQVRSLWESLEIGSYLLIMDTQLASRFRNYVERFQDSRVAMTRTFEEEVAFMTTEGKRRYLKVRIYEKI